METGNSESATKRAAVNGLAVVGFVALIVGGITLAIYAARFVPSTVHNLGTAAVYFSSSLSTDEKNQLEVVPNDNDTVIPFPDEVVALATTTEETVVPAQTPNAFRPGAVATAPTSTQTTVYVPPTPVFVPATLSGLSDLTVTITERGYLESGSSSSYVKASEVPNNKRGAIKFVVENKGTNVSGEWKFKAEVPTSPSFTFTSAFQDSLSPGQHVEYVLGFDRAKAGDNRVITITVDSAKDVEESNERNNDDSETLVIN